MNRSHYQWADNLPSKDDIAMNLATDGFRFVAFEQDWNMEQASQLFSQLGDIENNLSDADCDEFVEGLQNCLHDSELLYLHVTSFTRKMLKKWQIIDLTNAVNED